MTEAAGAAGRGRQDERHDERHDERPRRRRRDSLWAIGLLVLAVGVVVRLALGGLSAWPSALLGAVAMAFWVPWLVRHFRRRDASASGTEPADVPGMERQILRGDPPPRDPRRREELAALVDSRQRRLRRSRWWAFPLLAAVFFGTSVAWFSAGSTATGGVMLALGVAFLAFMTWSNVRFDRRLSRMRRQLRSRAG
ncbi:hypothetical protein [Streptomyces sp. CRN 30]|uniref:hypothetical protein n=1 Tax=Streptomyces sp. CRN 30 TaxID=3075613 RepID=UPI002A8330F0|nr:hypothetical protein [Streptomyces sp. CRN 30]